MTRRARYLRKWPTVQDYLDCDDPRRTNQATRSMDHWQNAAFREKQRQIMLKRMRDPETRARLRQRLLELWQDPAYRARQLRTRARPDTRQHYHQQRWGDQHKGAQHGVKMRARWNDPEYRQRMRSTMIQAQKDPALRQRHSEISRKRWQDPEYRQRLAVSMKRAWQRRRSAE